MAFWWPLLVLGFVYAICRFLLMLIPPNVPSIDVDASDVLDDGSQTKENGYIYIPRKGKAAQSDRVHCYETATMMYLGYFPALTTAEVLTPSTRMMRSRSEAPIAGDYGWGPADQEVEPEVGEPAPGV